MRVVLCVEACERVLAMLAMRSFEMDEAGLDWLRPIGSGSMVALCFSRFLRVSHAGWLDAGRRFELLDMCRVPWWSRLC